MKKKRILIPLMIVIVFFLVSAAVFLVFVRTDTYGADDTALAAAVTDSRVTVTEKDGNLIFASQHYRDGLIFYPGAKVDYRAYAPLMQEIARNDMLCILVKMPFDLAVLNPNAADGIQEAYPQVRHWYIGGHSFGGAMAAQYADTHREELDGLILLAAYSTVDLSDSSLNVLSIYGSNDNVLNKEAYKNNYSHLPPDTKEYVIEGGCHAYFGSYGAQKGDGVPTISAREQIDRTAGFIAEQTQREER